MVILLFQILATLFVLVPGLSISGLFIGAVLFHKKGVPVQLSDWVERISAFAFGIAVGIVMVWLIGLIWGL